MRQYKDLELSFRFNRNGKALAFGLECAATRGLRAPYLPFSMGPDRRRLNPVSWTKPRLLTQTQEHWNEDRPCRLLPYRWAKDVPMNNDALNHDPWVDPVFAQSVRDTAYFLWENDGRPQGRENGYWFRAPEQCLRQRQADDMLLQSPASNHAGDQGQSA